MNTNRSRFPFLAVIVILALALGACGDDGDADSIDPADGASSETGDDTGETDEVETTDAPEDATEDSAEAGPPPDEPTEDAEPPAEDFGTVTIDGVATELAGADFLICETVNPAFDETINIVVRFEGAPSELRIAGDLPDDVSAEIGEIFERVTVDGIDVIRDGRTVSGSVESDGSLIEFSFTC